MEVFLCRGLQSHTRAKTVSWREGSRRVLKCLSQRGVSAAPGFVEEALADCEDVDDGVVEGHFARLRNLDRYLADFAPLRIRDHLRLLDQLSEDQLVAVAVRPTQQPETLEVTVAGADMVGVTACVTGSLADFGLPIRDLEVMTYEPHRAAEADHEPAAGDAPTPAPTPSSLLRDKYIMVLRVGADESQGGDDLQHRLTLCLKAAYWHLIRGDIRQAQRESHDQDEMAGQVLEGRFRLDRRLAQGGMGKVYLATQLDLSRPVIVKLLRRELSEDAQFVADFRRESRLLAQAHSPYLVHVYASGSVDGRYWMALEYVSGGDVDHWMTRNHLPPFGLAARWLRDALAGLRYIHEELGLMHCDMKPANLLLDAKHNLKIGDLGLSQLWRLSRLLLPDGSVRGTPMYMSPEQARGENLDQRTDLFSLGSTFFYMLTGSPPFEASGNAELVSLVARGEAPLLSEVAPDAPAPLAVIIDRLMRGDMLRRYQKAAVALADLESYSLDGLSGDFSQSKRATALPRTSPRHDSTKTFARRGDTT